MNYLTISVAVYIIPSDTVYKGTSLTHARLQSKCRPHLQYASHVAISHTFHVVCYYITHSHSLEVFPDLAAGDLVQYAKIWDMYGVFQYKWLISNFFSFYSEVHFPMSEWVIKFNGLSGTADSGFLVIHISPIIIIYTLESLSSFTYNLKWIDPEMCFVPRMSLPI